MPHDHPDTVMPCRLQHSSLAAAYASLNAARVGEGLYFLLPYPAQPSISDSPARFPMPALTLRYLAGCSTPPQPQPTPPWTQRVWGRACTPSWWRLPACWP